MKLGTESINHIGKIKKLFTIIATIIIAVLPLAIITYSSVQNNARALSDSDLNKFGQNDIMFYDPTSTCTSSGYLCGNTAREKYWTALSQYIDDPIKIAGIVGNLVHEGGMNPVAWEGVITKSDGSLVNNWDFYYNGYDDGKHGVGAFAITSGLSNYLKAVSDEAPELLKYFQDTTEYNFNYVHPGAGVSDTRPTYGDVLLEKIGDAEFDKLVDFEVKYAIEKFNPSRTEGYLSQNFSSPSEAAAWWMKYWEIPASYSSLGARQMDAEKAYDDLKDFHCSGSSSTASSSSSSDGSDVTIIGDSITVGSEAKIKELLPQADIYAKVSKQFYTGSGDNPGGVEILQDLVNNEKLRDILVFALGTNSSGVTEEQVKKVIDLAGNKRKVIFVTNYTKTNDYLGNNNNFEKAKNDNKNVFVADWKGAIESNPDEYLAGDGIHPNAKGQELFAKTIDDAVNGASSSSDLCAGSVDGGLSEEQAQRLIDYYNSSETNISEYGFGTKKNCVAFSVWFIKRFTEIGNVNRRWGNGREIGHLLVQDLGDKYNLQCGTEPRPFSVFSVTIGVARDASGVPYGHTGIIFSVDGDTVESAEAALDMYAGQLRTYSKSWFENTLYPDCTFVYLEDILLDSELSGIVGN